VDIDGTNGGSLIRLDGSKLPAGLVADGLVFQGGDSTMKGMSITGFENGSGVVFDGVTRGNPARGITMGRNQLLEQNYIGTDPSGAAGLGNQIGVEIIASSDNTIGGAAVAQADGTIATPLNVISGNLDDGISIHSMNIARPGATPVFVTSQRNLIAGNFIGLAPDGKTALGNSEAGIFLGQGSVGNVIGGPAGQARTLHNVISGNTHQPGVPGGYGIIIDGVPRDRSPGNWIRGNFIGTDRSGTAKVPNDVGIQIEPGAIAPGNSPTLIGEVRPSPGIGVPGQSIVNDPANLISGNNLFGILLRGDRTQVLGNFIGTALDGVSGLSNGQDGIRIDNGGRNRDFSLNATG
jgi:titin